MTIRSAIISTARNWWLRSPNPSNANNVRNVNSDGSLNNNNAYNGNSAAADCEISEHRVRTAAARNPSRNQSTHTGSGRPSPETEEYRPRMQAGCARFLLSTAAIFGRE